MATNNTCGGTFLPQFIACTNIELGDILVCLSLLVFLPSPRRPPFSPPSPLYHSTPLPHRLILLLPSSFPPPPLLLPSSSPPPPLLSSPLTLPLLSPLLSPLLPLSPLSPFAHHPTGKRVLRINESPCHGVPRRHRSHQQHHHLSHTRHASHPNMPCTRLAILG